jgi:hypothetical protein
VVGDPAEAARIMTSGIADVRQYRRDNKDAFFFNWSLKVAHEFQQPFRPTHANMAGLNLHRDQPRHLFAANLRRAFSGIVAGNVKEDGMRMIEQHGLFEINGEADIMQALDGMLASFVEQHRMKLPGTGTYQPCYRIKVG